MGTKKISLANIQGKLSRSEMKNIMAGSGSNCSTSGCCSITNCNGTCTASATSCTCQGATATLTKNC
jgi:hypothetical protein